MKILTICIPTYKRSDTLRDCIESVSQQIEKYDLADCVGLYVANDASPDNTLDILTLFESLSYFKAITRDVNLGMNVNIKTMFTEIAEQSEYQLIITDDDYLQPDTLNEIVEFLRIQNATNKDVSAIWTPRFSYTEDNKLHTVACRPFNKSTFVKPSVSHVGKYMNNGFVLSGLIVRAQSIDYQFWDKYKENAYFPILFFGDLLLQKGAFYWDKNIMHHTVLNECHWDRWGKNDAMIDFRLFSDYINSYSIMAKYFQSRFELINFYFFASPSIYKFLVGRLMSGKLTGNRAEILEAMSELKNQGAMNFDTEVKVLMLFSLIISANISVFKIIITRFLLMITKDDSKKRHYKERLSMNWSMLKSLPILIKSVFV